jgi:hypothetical protein
MAILEDLRPNATIRGVLPTSSVTVVSVQWFGSEAIELTYKDPSGKVANELLYRHDEPRLELVEEGRPWSFDGDGHLFRLVSEAQRIHLAHLFDPVLAVHTSMVEPLPHQITAVYECMLPRQPLRFLLADDPGAGKTIMAGLFIRELIARGDLQRCLVVCPGSLAEQWQDELYHRFNLPFEILTNDKLEAARSGNWFLEANLVIARLDKLSRNEGVQLKLQAPDCHWDLVICDEAHKLSATFTGGEVRYTKRYRLAQLLSTLTRHFLLMTATPHNGKEEDFQLFMALLDGDRFEGRFRDGVHVADVSDLMRRMVKENLLKFDATPLFPERIAYTVPYRLSDPEAALYKAVTEYVRDEFNRAEALENDKRAGTVGFALFTVGRMTLKGQWIARYSGTNTGTAVLDLDEYESHFAGIGVAWDDNRALPSSMVKVITPSKSGTQHLKDVPVVALDYNGNRLTPEALQQLQTTGLAMPATVDIDLQLNGASLSMGWKSSIGTSGAAVATASKTRASLPSDLVPTALRGWEGFKRTVNALEQKRYIFRGQEDNRWRLRSSFHRTGRADLDRYLTDDIQDLQKTFSALTQHTFNLSDPLHYAAFINLAQHHGYPTPMLDWTWSPYVAAFFAFRNAKASRGSGRKVRIYKADSREWNKLYRAGKVAPERPNVTIINALAFGNARAIPQQSLSLTSNVDDIETHIALVEGEQLKRYLEVFDLPASDRNFIMKELALMGITAGALFPGLDGACESLRERNFSQPT